MVFSERIDHRSFADQGISGPTTVHVGRDNRGANSDVVQERLDHNAYVHAQRELARIEKQERLIQKQLQRITSAIIDLETTLAQALAEQLEVGFTSIMRASCLRMVRETSGFSSNTGVEILKRATSWMKIWSSE